MGSGGREKGETKVHEQDKQIGVGMTTTTSGEREREKYRRETGDRTHICQEVLGSVTCDIMDGGALCMRD